MSYCFALAAWGPDPWSRRRVTKSCCRSKKPTVIRPNCCKSQCEGWRTYSLLVCDFLRSQTTYNHCSGVWFLARANMPRVSHNKQLPTGFPPLRPALKGPAFVPPAVNISANVASGPINQRGKGCLLPLWGAVLHLVEMVGFIFPREWDIIKGGLYVLSLSPRRTEVASRTVSRRSS